MRAFLPTFLTARWAFRVALSLALTGLWPAQAQVLISSLPEQNDDFGWFISAGANQLAVGITTPSQSYDVSNVKLRMEDFNGGVPSVGFYTDSASKPGSLVGSLLNNPGGLSDTAILTLTFTANPGVTLAANTKYWLLITSAQNGYLLFGADPPQSPSGLAGFDGAILSNDGGSSFGPSANIPALEISAVPEPGATALTVGAALAVWAGWRSRRRERNSILRTPPLA